jgi:two-component system, chemotaxis family, protein-glutamate methylesterase/glutaminase
MVRILVVDDTVVYRKAVSTLLAETPGVEVVGVAANGKIALQMCEQFRPDLLTLDVEMPEMNGLDVLRALRAQRSPSAAIMLSAVTTAGATATIAALELGAFDFVVKPTGVSAVESAAVLRRELLPKIEAFARTRPAAPRPAPAAPPPPAGAVPSAVGVGDAARSVVRAPSGKPDVVAIGISTGGPQALASMLPGLPGDLAVPVLIVQHMPPLFTRSLAESLNGKCALAVQEAVDGQVVTPGTVLIAPGGKQMKVERVGGEPRVRITDDPPENSCRPAVDYLFRSVAHAYGANVLGVIMTGMGNDGTLGCRLLKRNGATVLTQDQASCVVYGMPKQPADEKLSDVVAPLNRIADEITRLVGRRKPACV